MKTSDLLLSFALGLVTGTFFALAIANMTNENRAEKLVIEVRSASPGLVEL